MGLQFVELVMEVEDRFGIHLDDDAAANALTVGDLASIVENHLRARQHRDHVMDNQQGGSNIPMLSYRERRSDAPRIPPEEAWPIVRELTARLLKVPLSYVTRNSRFIQDLGAG